MKMVRRDKGDMLPIGVTNPEQPETSEGCLWFTLTEAKLLLKQLKRTIKKEETS